MWLLETLSEDGFRLPEGMASGPSHRKLPPLCSGAATPREERERNATMDPERAGMGLHRKEGDAAARPADLFRALGPLAPTPAVPQKPTPYFFSMFLRNSASS